ncbi:guanine nucleotide exchange factor DBS-like isoform X1 [Microplitis mediator]|uniref:guanine nucleotide exchange factor DBS-like isoform X1 n=2 Tax=Microplitis mediator TaxID=375433 RepID=UPI002553C72C|nr:guanine nucleotide exchange factor DBS-like isoform X1 [Microplitis mediator]
MANSPTSIENQIDSFLEQFKRSASRAMEDNARGSYNASSSISRSRSGNLDLEVFEAEDVESMTGEIENGDLAVRDVADLLQHQYAIITGGKTREGCPIITFPDNGNFHNLSDLDYQRLMLYLTSVPTLQEADLGFHLIIDRRTDKWNSVKTVLIKISAFFPGLVHVAYVLRPVGFLQKAISEVSNKLFREDFKFRVIVLANVTELYDFIDKDQLTEQLGGDLPYCHTTWIQNRISLEKFSSMTQDVSLALDSFTRRLAEIEFPNNTIATTRLLNQQQAEYNELKEEILSAARHGEALLDSVRQLTGKSTADRLGNVAAVERLLVQLEETERTFDLFWSHHSSRLRHCLALRQFEQDFRELQASLDQHLKTVDDMTEVGETQVRVDQLIRDTSTFQRICRGDIDRAEEVIAAGQQLLSGRHQCPTEVVEPKCAELQRVCTILSQRLERRLHTLTKCRELMERIDKANAWCTRGIELLASQNSAMPTDQALQELEQLVEAAEEFHSPRCIFQDSIMPETKALVAQVLQRIEDVTLMCEKKIIVLKQQLIKPARPVQTVTPEPAKPLQASPQIIKPGRVLKKANTMPKMEMGPIEGGDSSSPESEPRDIEAMRLKRGHVLTELVETERAYVAELGSIIKGYIMEMTNETMSHLIPSALIGKSDVLFGNLEEIYHFHGETFLRDLENCISNTELVALCFVQRRDIFFRLYSYYCQNITRSESLREQIQGEPQFLAACQQKLGHKLPLAAYLLKPVQRITKYQLLLKDLLKYSDEPACCTELQEALDCMLIVLKCVNDSMHQTAISGFGGDLNAQGELLLQGSFSVWSSSKRERLLRLKPSQRHIFLYEKAMIFCKHSKPQAHNKATYHFKRFLKMSQIGLTESVKGDTRRFEIWLQGRAEVHTIQAPSNEVKQSWVRQIKGVLMSQLAELKGKQNTALAKSNHKPLRQTISWETQSVSGSLRTLSVDGNSVISHVTDVSQSTEEDVAWSSENSNTDDEDAFSENPGPAPGGRYVALADYCAVGQSEVTMREGDHLELLKVGCAGWWFVKLIGTGIEGWAPAAYLEPVSRKTSRSSQSVNNSQEVI